MKSLIKDSKYVKQKILVTIDLCKLVIIVYSLLNSFEAHAHLSNERFECEILQTQEVNERGYQVPARFVNSFDKGVKFTVSRKTGLILGKEVSTEGWENRVIGRGLDGQNSFVSLATAKNFAKHKDETNGTWFMVVETYKGNRDVPFFLRTSMGILITGVCH
jgi:hypothetical protein